MTWRIHFTSADLDRVRICPSAGPLAETMLAFSFLRCPLQPQAMFAGWRAAALGRLSPEMAPLAALVPAGSRGVDLYTLTGETATIEQGILALLSVDSADLLGEISSFDRQHRLPRQAWAMATDGPPGTSSPGRSPPPTSRSSSRYWPRVSAQLNAAQVARRRLMATGGADGLLASLRCPTIRWRSPVLELAASTSLDLHLNGSGLIIAGSMFAGRIPSLYLDGRDPGAPPRLVLPVADASATGQPGGAVARRRGGAGRADRPDQGHGAARHHRRMHDLGAGPAVRRLDGGGQPARDRAARGRA